MVMTEKKPFCCDLILPVGFIKQAGGMIVMVAKLWMVKLVLASWEGFWTQLQPAVRSISILY